MPTITCAGLFFSDFWLASGTAYPPNKYPVESISQWVGSLALKSQNILNIYYLCEPNIRFSIIYIKNIKSKYL